MAEENSISTVNVNFEPLIKAINGDENSNIQLIKDIAIKLFANINFEQAEENKKSLKTVAQECISRAIVLATELKKLK